MALRTKEQYIEGLRKMKRNCYFNGELTAYGLFTDRSGRVARRFVVALKGRWDGDDGVLWDDQASEAAKRGTRRTLIQVLESWLRLLHPLMPFITEEIWQTVAPLAGKTGDTIMLQPYPESDQKGIDSAANADIEWLKNVIVGVRNIRGEMNIPPGKQLTVLLANGDERDKSRLENNAPFLKKLAKQQGTKRKKVVTACTADELAQDDPETEHGIFTTYFLEGLKQAEDSDGNGYVTLYEVFRYLDRKVRERSAEIGQRQHPQWVGDPAYPFLMKRISP